MPRLTELIRNALLKGHEALKGLPRDKGKIYGRGAYGDLSYEFDILVEKTLIDFIRKNLEDSLIISEEAGIVGSSNPKYYVLIDPIDGSKNARRGIPFYCSSITISAGPSIADILAAGVIDHLRGEIYLGERGSGVYISDGKPSLNSVKSLKEAMVLVDHGSFRSPKTLGWALRILDNCWASRFLAAASLEIAFILKGIIDGFICLGRTLKLMDFLAPIFLLRLAGGSYKILDGGDDVLLTSRTKFGVIAASTHELLNEILSLE